MQLTQSEVKLICWEDHEDFTTVEESEWTQGGRYQNQDIIVLHEPTGKYYEISISRSGSPFTDWEYDFPDEIVEVEKQTRTTTVEVWVVVPQA